MLKVNNIMFYGGFVLGIVMFFCSVFLWFRFRIKQVFTDLIYFGSKKRWKAASISRKTAKLSNVSRTNDVTAGETTKLGDNRKYSGELEIIEDITLVNEN